MEYADCVIGPADATNNIGQPEPCRLWGSQILDSDEQKILDKDDRFVVVGVEGFLQSNTKRPRTLMRILTQSLPEALDYSTTIIWCISVEKNSPTCRYCQGDIL